MEGRVYYNKLIRDRIPQKITNNEGAYEVRPCVDDAEFQQELLKKVKEEAEAVANARSKEEYLSELADLLVVLRALQSALGITDQEVDDTVAANEDKKGGFDERLILHWSSDKNYKSNETPQGIKAQ